MIINGRSYYAVIGSDPDREGMFLELGLERGNARHALAESFCSDMDGSIETTIYAADIDEAALAWLRDEGARQLLTMRRTVLRTLKLSRELLIVCGCAANSHRIPLQLS